MSQRNPACQVWLLLDFWNERLPHTICKYSDYNVFYVFLNSKHNHYEDGTANPFLICPAAEWPQMGKDVCLLSVGWQGLSLVKHLEVIPQHSESVAWLARNICVTDRCTSLCESLLGPRLWNTLSTWHQVSHTGRESDWDEDRGHTASLLPLASAPSHGSLCFSVFLWPCWESHR